MCTIGWSDLALNCDFRKLACCCRSGVIVHFNESNSKFGLACACSEHAQQSFDFQKFTGTLKMNIISENLQICTFLQYFKEQSPRRKVEIKKGYKLIFDWSKDKQCLVSLHFQLLLNPKKTLPLVQVQGNSQHFLNLGAKLKIKIKM